MICAGVAMAFPFVSLTFSLTSEFGQSNIFLMSQLLFEEIGNQLTRIIGSNPTRWVLKRFNVDFLLIRKRNR